MGSLWFETKALPLILIRKCPERCVARCFLQCSPSRCVTTLAQQLPQGRCWNCIYRHQGESYYQSSPLWSQTTNKTRTISLQEQCVTQHQFYLADFNLFSRFWIWLPLVSTPILLVLSFSRIWVVALLLCPDLSVWSLCLCYLVRPVQIPANERSQSPSSHLLRWGTKLTILWKRAKSQILPLSLYTQSKITLGSLMCSFCSASVNKKRLVWVKLLLSQIALTGINQYYFPYRCCCCFCAVVADF